MELISYVYVGAFHKTSHDQQKWMLAYEAGS